MFVLTITNDFHAGMFYLKYLSYLYFQKHKRHKMPSKDQFLLKSDCEIEPASPFPGKRYRQNPGGCSDSRAQWIENEANKWVNNMKHHPKYLTTPLYQRSFCLKYHLRKLTVANSECRKILIKVESDVNFNQEVNDPQDDNMEIDDQRLADNVQDMDTEPPPGSQDMFANSDGEDEELSRVEKEKVIIDTLKSPIEDLLKSENSLPYFVMNSHRYKTSKNNFIEEYLEENFKDATIEELVNSLTPLPNYVRESPVFKKKINTLSDQQKSEKRMLKNLNSTLSLLRDSSTKTALEHRKIITGAVYDHFCGFPNIDETKAVKKEAKVLKTNLLSGETSDLKPKERQKVDFFPASVKEVAEKCWRTNCTVVEPGKHTRPKSALRDGEEVIPAIYQTLTDSEAFAVFKDNYHEEVREAMEKECNDVRISVEGRRDSGSKQKLLDMLIRKQTRFPSFSWFLQQKPKETKFRSDHCTGLCKDCEGPQLNLDSLTKFMRKLCRCRSKLCPKWSCSCDLDENGEVKEHCDCDSCDCDECLKCEVSV